MQKTNDFFLIKDIIEISEGLYSKIRFFNLIESLLSKNRINE